MIVTLIATALGAGLLPGMPGTFGTLMAVPLGWWLLGYGRPVLLLGLLGVTVAGTLAADRYCRDTGTQDNQQIVIDEVAGFLLTVLLSPRTPLNFVLGFALFRLFDIWKPWPVSLIDRKVHGGLGVMADDLMAGVYAALALYALQQLPLSRLPGGG